MDPAQTLISEVYFRLDHDQMEHSRAVMDFIDLMGAIGGIPEIIRYFISIVIGTYISFHSTIMNIGSLYKLKSKYNLKSLRLTPQKSYSEAKD